MVLTETFEPNSESRGLCELLFFRSSHNQDHFITDLQVPPHTLKKSLIPGVSFVLVPYDLGIRDPHHIDAPLLGHSIHSPGDKVLNQDMLRLAFAPESIPLPVQSQKLRSLLRENMEPGRPSP